ncbi:MAG: hypothetical protein ACR2G4_00405 [Pyrinomonadaceae bacterium]
MAVRFARLREALRLFAGFAGCVVGSFAGFVTVASEFVAAPFIGSVAPPADSHASHPPTRARGFLNPLALRICAARALVCSLGQAQ